MRAVYDSRHEGFSHGTSYVACSRTTTFTNLGFLHAPLDGDNQRPAFVNIVIQKALGTGVLQGTRKTQAASVPGVFGEEGEGDTEDEQEDLEEGLEGPRDLIGGVTQPATTQARQRLKAQGATLQPQALSLRERREATYNEVKARYNYL